MADQLDYPDVDTLQRGDILWPRDPKVIALPTSLAELVRLALDTSGDKVKQVLALAVRVLDELANRMQPDQRPTLGAAARSIGRLNARVQPDHYTLTTFSQMQTWEHWPEWLDLLRWMPEVDDLIRLYLAQLFSVGAGGSGGTRAFDTEGDVEFGWLRSALGIEPSRATFFGVYVGHVAMVERDANGRPWVLESSYTAGGVHLERYEDWLAARMRIGALVWHGRITDSAGHEIGAAQASTLLDEGHLLRQQRKLYAIFDRVGSGYAPLGDKTYVYCTEFIWCCARAIGIDLDSRQDPKLGFFGPRALSRSTHVKMLNEPRGQAY